MQQSKRVENKILSKTSQTLDNKKSAFSSAKVGDANQHSWQEINSYFPDDAHINKVSGVVGSMRRG